MIWLFTTSLRLFTNAIDQKTRINYTDDVFDDTIVSFDIYVPDMKKLTRIIIIQ